MEWGGLSQLIAGAFEMRKGNTFGFTAFTSFGAFWIFYALLNIFTTFGVISVNAIAISAVFFIWGTFSLLLWIPAMMASKATNIVFLLLWITLFLLAFGLSNTGGYGVLLTRIGGCTGIAAGALAAYTGLAGIVNSMGGRLPVGKGVTRWTATGKPSYKEDLYNENLYYLSTMLIIG